MSTITEQQREVFLEADEWNRTHYTRQAMRTGRRRAPRSPMKAVALRVGDRVKFHSDRRWWDVRAVSPSGSHAVLTRTQAFGREGLVYTIVSWTEGRRGPHTSLASWPIDTEEQCDAIAAAMDSGADAQSGIGLALSERYSIRLDVAAVRRRPMS